MKTMICSQCGAGLELTEDKEFFVCQACGTKVYNMSNENLQITKEKIEETVDEIFQEKREKEYSEKQQRRVAELLKKRISLSKQYMVVGIAFMIIAIIIFVPVLAFVIGFHITGNLAFIVWSFFGMLIGGIMLFGLFFLVVGFSGYRKAKNERY